MSKSGVIVIIEDDLDDRKFLGEIIKELNVTNELKWFETSEEALDFISTTFQSIFIILSDVNLPGKSGLEFKKTLDDHPELRRKSIPFIFYSTAANQDDVNEAFLTMTTQGFFKKGPDYENAKNAIKVILDYWRLCRHPNTQ